MQLSKYQTENHIWQLIKFIGLQIFNEIALKHMNQIEDIFNHFQESKRLFDQLKRDIEYMG